MQALSTRRGVLLFDGSGFGQLYMKEYLQYVADNYFKPYGRTLGYLKHYGLRSDDTLRQSVCRQHRMFSVLDGSFLRRKESYLDSGILHGHRLLKLQPLGIDSHSFRTFVEHIRSTPFSSEPQYLAAAGKSRRGLLCRLCRPEGISCLAAFRFSEIDSALHRQIAHGVSQYGSINRSQLDTQARKEAERAASGSLRYRSRFRRSAQDGMQAVCRPKTDE
ncbi:MAG: DUF6047 family protein [Alistipes indistinctus]